MPLWLTKDCRVLLDVQRDEERRHHRKSRCRITCAASREVRYHSDSVRCPARITGYNERDKQGVFYAESWALCHYLMFGNNRARGPQLTQFLGLLGGGMNVERAFNEAFKTGFTEMEKELRRYVQNHSYPVMIYTLRSTESEKEVSVRALSEAEVQYNLGNLLMRINRLDDAEAYFSRAAALDAGLAGPYEGRGFIAMRRNKYDEAREQFQKAAALGSQNHLVHYYYAESIQRELREAAIASRSSRPTLPER